MYGISATLGKMREAVEGYTSLLPRLQQEQFIFKQQARNNSSAHQPWPVKQSIVNYIQPENSRPR